MTRALFSRLSSQSGETLAETLVAMLVAGLSIVMLSTAIAAGSRIILRTKTTAQNYIKSTNSLVNGTGDTSGTVVVKETSEKLSGSSSVSVKVTEVKDETALPGGKPAISYKPNIKEG